MTKLLKNIFSMRFSDAKTGSWAGTPMGQPLKYRESNYTVAELEKRLVAELNGFASR
jgi:hypothetical protein|tara:strand:- start:794 stop:964 length:171 start_codon:yes stop_codon:yes gene_type:complete